MHGFVSYQRFGRARSLRSDRAWLRARLLHSDRAERTLDCYVATELGPNSDAQSLRSDQAWLELGRYVVTGLGSSSVAT
ncbi:hypothetical protein F2Q69_00014653 [Brassica cretica]|uniref:Uncharacterized protein n=1 Tax=Brassica cretica TaxID=69181 RepID=A0A8S9R2T2_BRACR|nr:hypothetical protein F2Q69_00014653 [Brassica cretica]